jgi:prepilin-type processing-associated H-X9-DG protein
VRGVSSVKLKKTDIAAIVIVGALVVLLVYYGVYLPAAETQPRICLSHLQEMSTGLQVYVGESGYLPPADKWRDGLSNGQVSGGRTFICSEARLTAEQEKEFGQRKGSGVPFSYLRDPSAPALPDGYAMFAPLSAKPAVRLADPGKTPFVYDSNIFLPNASDKLESMDFRHLHGTANVTFLDGHAESVTTRPQPPATLFLTGKNAPPIPKPGSSHGFEPE